jgi:hypothetical protein
LRPRYRFLWLPHDRSVFPRIGEASGFIENVAFEDPSVIEPLVHSAIADLWFLQSCSAFIGTFNSEFSILAWLLCIGNNGHVIPYVNLAKRSDIEYWQGSMEACRDGQKVISTLHGKQPVLPVLVEESRIF